MIGGCCFSFSTPMADRFVSEYEFAVSFVGRAVVFAGFSCHAPAPSAWASAALARLAVVVCLLFVMSGSTLGFCLLSMFSLVV